MNLQSPLRPLATTLRAAAVRLLNQEVTDYELVAPNDMARLCREIRKGDVILVDGRLRISQLIKYTTQSPWSHCALYVGDELLRRGGTLRERVLAQYGARAEQLLIEALVEDGVVAGPLDKYADHNLRICRASRIKPAALGQVVDSVIEDLDKQYDSRNLLDLALLFLSPIRLGFLKTRTAATCLGHCTEREVICSGMIAKAFQRAGYSLFPQVARVRVATDPRAEGVTMRHHSQILPRDFDLSPNFHTVRVSNPDAVRSNRKRAPWKRLGLRNVSPN